MERMRFPDQRVGAFLGTIGPLSTTASVYVKSQDTGNRSRSRRLLWRRALEWRRDNEKQSRRGGGGAWRCKVLREAAGTRLAPPLGRSQQDLVSAAALPLRPQNCELLETIRSGDTRGLDGTPHIVIHILGILATPRAASHQIPAPFVLGVARLNIAWLSHR